MADAHANFAYSTVATAPSPATSGTSLVVATGDGVRFPTVPFNATVWPTGSSPTAANAEIVRVTAISTDTLTITRTQEGSSARTVVVGDQIAATVTAKTLTDAEQGLIAGFCGDGSDGNVTISGTTTLTRDMWYDTLTVQSGGTLKTVGFKVYCKTLCQVDSGGTIHANGTAATSATAAAASTAGSLGVGQAGANGTTTAGATLANISYLGGGSGGAGGTGASGAGGAGRLAPSLFAANSQFRQLPQSSLGFLWENSANTRQIGGGASGGGGGGDTTNSGGGGGTGGNVLIINARTVINNGTITATGGAGFSTTTGNTGGGGGGGGGLVIVNTTSFTGTTPTAAGGAGGTKTGTGTNGTAGTTGTVSVLVWS